MLILEGCARVRGLSLYLNTMGLIRGKQALAQNMHLFFRRWVEQGQVHLRRKERVCPCRNPQLAGAPEAEPGRLHPRGAPICRHAVCIPAGPAGQPSFPGRALSTAPKCTLPFVQLFQPMSLPKLPLLEGREQALSLNTLKPYPTCSFCSPQNNPGYP